ncbi:hypothetical protein T4D_7007 [Trichinella pseudospiralis]|uniref:Uncharacterized protein n=1 Tax=Trichinella pseudospiralis TaxID=6337 RepID=A0A0V1FQB5_TRIPS|nr:hypothetical protein T4D_7007 [Trichinella pseudospiralis]
MNCAKVDQSPPHRAHQPLKQAAKASFKVTKLLLRLLQLQQHQQILLLLLLLLLLNTATAVADRSTPGHKSSATIWCPAVISKAGGDVVNAIEHSNNNGGQTAKLISSQFRKQSQLRPHPLLDTGQPWRPPEASTSRNRHASMINYNSTFFHFSSVQATAVQLDIEE